MKTKKLKLIFFVVFYSFFSVLYSSESKIIIKVDNKVITSYELKNKILTTLILAGEDINQENINQTKPLVLRSLIELKIKENEIKKYNIEVSDSEVKKNLETFSKGNLQQFQQKFKSNNLNFEIFKNDLKTELAWRKLIYVLYNKKVKINESEIELEFNKILNNDQNINYRLSELMVNFTDEIEKNKKIEEIEEQINSIGFDKTFIKYNDSMIETNLGDLGWVNSEALSKNILNSVKNLKINEVSKPIIVGNTILFLKMIDKKKIELKDENIENIKNKILNAKKNQRYNLYSNSHLSKLKNISIIKYQ